MVHELLAAILPPVSDRFPDPAVARDVPPQVLVSPLGVATSRLAGKVSVNPTPVRATVLADGLVMVMLMVLAPLIAMPVGLKALVVAGGATTTMLAEAVPPVPPSVEITLPVVLFFVPAAVPVTFTAKLQEALAASVAPERLITFVPWVAVIVPPPHVPVCPLGVETTRPAGRVSLNPTPVSVVVVLLFWMVKLSEVEPFSGMLAAPNDLLMAAGPVPPVTLIEAVVVLPVIATALPDPSSNVPVMLPVVLI
jgi:hypothetical protein